MDFTVGGYSTILWQIKALNKAKRLDLDGEQSSTLIIGLAMVS